MGTEFGDFVNATVRLTGRTPVRQSVPRRGPEGVGVRSRSGEISVTYCLAIRIDEGIVALADSRISSGNQVTHARKAELVGPDGARFLVMTSGLRSVRDKSMAYLERQLTAREEPICSMLDAVTIYTQCLRRVAEEDREAIEASGLKFDMHALIAGQMRQDAEPTVYLVYPEGNWIEITRRTPHLSIGATGYGKPILDRALRHDSTMATALKLAYLSFDSTRTSSMDVGFPIDLLTFSGRDKGWREAHYEYEDLQHQRQWWNEHLTQLANNMPNGPWTDDLIPAEGAAVLSVVGEDG